MNRMSLVATLVFSAVILTAPDWAAAGEKSAVVHIEKTKSELRVHVGGKPYFTYQYDTTNPLLRRPVIHPLYGPNGNVITQMGEVSGKRVKHFHHTGLWISHQNFTGGNNRQMDNDPTKKPRHRTGLLHRNFLKVESGNPARIVEQLEWDATDGKTILVNETRTITVPNRPAKNRIVDFEIALTANKKPVTLQRTPYQILAFRALDSMVPAFNKKAVITNSNGIENPKDGTPAKWIDVSGPVNGKIVGVTLFNHPKNLRHPTPCLNFAKQTIGLSPTHREAFTLEPGKTLRLRYRVLVHTGTTFEADVASEYEAYCREKK